MPRGIRRYGFFCGSVKEPYQAAIWHGALDAAAKNRASLLCFCGARLSTPIVGEAPGTLAYSLATRECVDGIIVLSAAIGTFVTEKDLRKFFATYAPLPVVSVGITAKGFTSVIVDNAAGMRGLMRHLVKRHGYRRFAFISGPPGHQEAELRRRVFMESLSEHGVSPDSARIARGDFSAESATLAVHSFLENGVVGRGGCAEVIVAANDRMAIAAIEELRRRSIRVPQEVAVVGFDDIDETRTATPALTTVRQPLFNLGQTAFETLCVYGATDSVLSLPPKTVIRESCGCAKASGPDSEPPDPPLAGIQEIEQTAAIRWTGSAFVASRDQQELYDSIAAAARQFGVPKCWLSLYEGGRRPEAAPAKGSAVPRPTARVPSFARLRLVARSDSHAVLGAAGVRFRTKKLVPEPHLDHGSLAHLILLPLHFNVEHLGFLLLEYARNAPQIHEEFRDYVTVGVKVARLMEKDRDH
jgi:DNA-binding LacI/PurR family transcriptional regulator